MSAEHIPTTDEIRYRVEHDWEPYGDGSFDAWLAQVQAEARADERKRVALQSAIRSASLFESAWDDGNAMGLDGWTGPERGTEPDDHAVTRRERLVDRLVDELRDRIEGKGTSDDRTN